MRRPRNDDGSERGAALIEFSLLFMFLMTIALGAFEFGMAFRDTLAISSATREAARVAGAVGDRTLGDCIILEAGAGALQSISGNQVAELWVYKTDTTGAVNTGLRNRYRPSRPTDNPASLICGTWFPIQRSWIETTRDNDGATRDWVGVRTVYDHAWKTGFLWWSGSVQWFEDAVMHLEPSL
ncbi:MAG TPA: TadE family protein [Acidimicrobiia bacterium]